MIYCPGRRSNTNTNKNYIPTMYFIFRTTVWTLDSSRFPQGLVSSSQLPLPPRHVCGCAPKAATCLRQDTVKRRSCPVRCPPRPTPRLNLKASSFIPPTPNYSHQTVVNILMIIIRLKSCIITSL